MVKIRKNLNRTSRNSSDFPPSEILPYSRNKLIWFAAFLALLFCYTCEGGENLVRNSGFEEGLENWTVPGWMMETSIEPKIDQAVVHGPGHGSLRLRGEEGTRGFLMQTISDFNPGSKYSLGAWVKKDGFENAWTVVIMTEYGYHDEEGNRKWGYFPVYSSWRFAYMEWNFLSREFLLPDNADILRVILSTTHPSGRIEPGRGNTGTAWFDNIELVEVAKDELAKAVSMPDSGLIKINRTVPLGEKGIFLHGEKAKIDVEIANTGETGRGLVLSAVVADFYDNEVHSFEEEIFIGAESGITRRLVIPAQEKYGFYGVNIAVKDKNIPIAKETTAFCVVSPYENRDPFFGMNAFVAGEPEAIARMGAGSYSQLLLWSSVERERGVFDFTAQRERLKTLLENGFNVEGYIHLTFTPGQNYVTPRWLEEMVLEWRESNEGFFPPEYYDLFHRYVYKTVKNFKDHIDTWQLGTEIDLHIGREPAMKEHFIKLYRAGAEAAKAADPDCIVGGIGVSGVDFQRGMPVVREVWPRVSDVLDGIFLDPYVDPKTFGPGHRPIGEERGGYRDLLLKALEIMAPSGKTLLAVDEKGYDISSDLPVDSPYAKDMARVMARGFIITRSIPEVKHYHYHNAGWRIREGGTDYGLWRLDSPRPTVAAYAATVRMMNGVSDPLKIKLHDDMHIYVFNRRGQTIAALWTVLPEEISLLASLPASAGVYDLMGNKRADLRAGRHEFHLTEEPIFLKSAAAPRRVAAALERGEFSLPLIKGQALFADARTMNVYIANQTTRDLTALVAAESPVEAGWAVPVQEANIPAGEIIPVPFELKEIDFLDFVGGDFSAKITVEGRETIVSKEIITIPVPRMETGIKVDGNLDKYRHLESLHLNSPQNIFPGGDDVASARLWLGPDDLSMRVWTAYDDDNFYFAAEVTDDVFVQEQTGGMIWAGDGFQISFNTLRDALDREISGSAGYLPTDYEYGIALTEEGPYVHCWTAAEINSHLTGAVEGTQLAIKKAGEGVWNYEWAVPWEYLLPLSPESGTVFGFNFNYIDIDRPGGGFVYAMGLTHGIVGGKDPSTFRPFVLE